MMIELGADPKCGGGCALRGAVRCGSLRLVKWLLGGGAGKGVVFDVCSLTMETQRACGQGRADLVEALLDGGGEVHVSRFFVFFWRGGTRFVWVLILLIGSVRIGHCAPLFRMDTWILFIFCWRGRRLRKSRRQC